MENIVICSDPGVGSCPAAHCGGGDDGTKAMLIMLPFALVAAFVVVAFCCSLRPASPASINGEDCEDAMLNASVPTLVAVQNLYANAKRRGIAFGSEMEEADLLRSKCGIAIARVMANIRDEMNTDAILLSPSDLRIELKAEFDDIDDASRCHRGNSKCKNHDDCNE